MDRLTGVVSKDEASMGDDENGEMPTHRQSLPLLVFTRPSRRVSDTSLLNIPIATNLPKPRMEIRPCR